MSPAYDGSRDWPAQSRPTPRKPRDKAQVGFPFSSESNMREQRLRHEASPSDDTRPQDVAPPNSTRLRGPNVQNANPAMSISRPAPAPQWPLQTLPTAVPPDSESYRPPPDRSRIAPQRPPRPSRVPSLVDQDRPQQATPLFSVPGGPESPSDIVESPSSDTPGPPRRSANLGPPPSSRRGQSSFYSTASYVTPIPEEGSGYKTHLSYASSAVMPDGRFESGVSPSLHGTFYEESLTDKPRYSEGVDYNDESRLVHGREEYALQSLNHGRSAGQESGSANPFIEGTGLVDESTDSSSNTSFTNRQTPANTSGMTSHLAAVPLNDGLKNPADHDIATGSAQPTSRLSAIRRPPRLDMDAVKEAESRGSLTSLPDLIRRATQLASMIDKGKRPGSRLDDLDFFNEKSGDSEAMRRAYSMSQYIPFVLTSSLLNSD